MSEWIYFCLLLFDWSVIWLLPKCNAINCGMVIVEQPWPRLELISPPPQPTSGRPFLRSWLRSPWWRLSSRHWGMLSKWVGLVGEQLGSARGSTGTSCDLHCNAAICWCKPSLVLHLAGSRRVQPVSFWFPVATLWWAVPAAGPSLAEPLPVSLQRLFLRELLRLEESLSGPEARCPSGLEQEVTLALSPPPLPGAVPAGQAGGHAGTAEGRGGLLHPAGAEQEPEAVPGRHGSLPLRQLSLAALGLLPPTALRLRSCQEPQSPAVAGQGPTGTAFSWGHTRHGAQGCQTWHTGRRKVQHNFFRLLFDF